jgi:2-aminobenzoate-CoA ligase
MKYRMQAPTAHLDTFAQERLPELEHWPQLHFGLPELHYPPRLNVVRTLLDDAVAEGHGQRPALHARDAVWTYTDLLERTSQIAHVLVQDLGLVPGNRVLLRGPNSPMLAAAWLAVLRAGGIAVTTMPMLRSRELAQIAVKARIDHALCEARSLADLTDAAAATGTLTRTLTFGDGVLEARMARRATQFPAVSTAADDVALLAFTSGTTGQPKATMHFHRDVLAMADVVARHLLRTGPDDIYIGSPPLGFTFGLGALLVFPLRFRGSAAYVEQPSAEALLDGVQRFRATCLFTAPTMYRGLLSSVGRFDLTSLRRCVSAGEALPATTVDAWRAATGIRLIDGIGATEMAHIFVGTQDAHCPPGATGRPLPGYEAAILDDEGRISTRGAGRLAVRGPTGCRYLDDPRQSEYVQQGWNITGDRYRIDDEGNFWFEGRTDDMIVSSGYNISGPEVESALLMHSAVRECAVVGTPDTQRGQIVTALVVVHAGHRGDAALAEALQNFVKQQIAPYKYPRAIQFVEALPRTPTGKIQRYRLRELLSPRKEQ